MAKSEIKAQPTGGTFTITGPKGESNPVPYDAPGERVAVAYREAGIALWGDYVDNDGNIHDMSEYAAAYDRQATLLEGQGRAELIDKVADAIGDNRALAEAAVDVVVDYLRSGPERRYGENDMWANTEVAPYPYDYRPVRQDDDG